MERKKSRNRMRMMKIDLAISALLLASSASVFISLNVCFSPIVFDSVAD